MPKNIKAEVKATALETRDFKARKGDIVEIPAEEKRQSPAVKHALQSGNLVIIDLEPVKSKPVKSEKEESLTLHVDEKP